MNALRHGLYARRLQVCGQHCAAWDGCPLAGADVSALPGHRRPVCPFEEAELSAFLGKEKRNPKNQYGDEKGGKRTDMEKGDQKNRDWDETAEERDEADNGFSLSPFSFSKEKGGDVDASYELALVRVMMGRAGVAVAHKGLVEETVAEGAQYRMRSSKPSAYLTAYLRIAQEYRRFRRLLGEEERDRAAAEALAAEREGSGGGLASMILPILEEADGVLEDCIE